MNTGRRLIRTGAGLGQVLFALAILAGCSPTRPPEVPAASSETPDPPRLVLVSWDGAADWVVDRLLDEGALPNLAAMAEHGARAEFSVTGFPSKTALGHATVWTGCWSDRHGVLSNDVPVPPPGEHTLLETRSGYSSEALAAEPIYVTAAKAGRRVVVLSATQSYPAGPHVEALREALGAEAEGDRLAEHYLSISGFENRLARGELLGTETLSAPEEGWALSETTLQGARELTTKVGDTDLFVLLYDDPGVSTEGLDTALIRSGSRDPAQATGETRLHPRPAPETAPLDPERWWSGPLPVTSGERRANVFFRLFRLAPDGSELALYRRTVHALDGYWPEPYLGEYLAAYPGFHDDPFWLYGEGGLGEPLMTGGDGTAERRTLEIVTHDLALTTAGSRWALAHLAPDLLMHYTPQSDSAGHTWIGVLDPRSPAYDAPLAARLWPYYRRVFELQDAWLGALVEAAGLNTVVALVSDHGMTGIGHYFQVNRVLERAGLLTRNEDGTIDLSRTRALAPPVWSPFSVWANTTDHAGGIVAPADGPAVLAEAEAVLLSAIDPDTGVHPVTRVLHPETARAAPPHLGFGPAEGGAIYFDLAPGYYPRSDLGKATGEPVVTPPNRPWGEGHHGFWPERPEMHAIFYVAGPGVAPGVTLHDVRHIDVAPTLSHLIGIPAPPCSEGRVLDEALVEEVR
ncbi:MAG: alkaline phosphatase family protein [Acidobacteria bacterium]|nr:alkaline phosphatase family protein [Acidobacteriota bacterium]